MKRVGWGVSLSAVVIMQSACMTTMLPSSHLKPIQSGDQNLSCSELAAEIGYMDNYIYEAQKSLRISGYGGTTSGSQRAARDVTEGSGFGGISGGDWERQQAQTQQFNLDKAKTRRGHLEALADEKNCT